MRILLVRVSSLGDVVHNMPMVADIHRHFPHAQIDWLVEEAYVELVKLNRGVHQVIPVALRRWRKNLGSAAVRAEISGFYAALRETGYDFVFDTQGLFKTGLLMRTARLNPGGQRFGLGNATEGSGYEAISRFFHHQSVPVPLHAHAVLRARLVAAAALGYAVDSAPDFNLRAPFAAREDGIERRRDAMPAWLPQQPYATFFHATARAAKQWPAAHWVALEKLLAERGLPVLLPWGSAAEKIAAQQLAGQMQGALVLPALTMMEAVLLAQRASIVVGLDTGLTHIAAAFDRPTVELYCDSPRWKTEGNWSTNIINLGDTGKPPALAEVEAAVRRLRG